MTLDCRTCGACCQLLVEVYPGDDIPDVFLDESGMFMAPRDPHARYVGINGPCIALEGDIGGPCRCTIYETRPAECRDFNPGSDACLDARRMAGVGTTEET